MNTKLFSEEEIEELETIFGLTRIILPIAPPIETLPVRDGYVTSNSIVWWRGLSGPELVTASSNWVNIKEYPDVYQIAEPTGQQVYQYTD